LSRRAAAARRRHRWRYGWTPIPTSSSGCARGRPPFLYEFAHPLAAPAHGVPHTSEIPFVFGTYADPFFAAKVGAGAAEQALSDRLISQWSRFAHGDMTGLHVFSVEQPNTMILGGPADLAEIVRETRFVELQAWGVV
jgi:para-nitrobenzyl esterase